MLQTSLARMIGSEDFEKAYLAELFDRVASTVRVIEELELLLHKVHADCD